MRTFRLIQGVAGAGRGTGCARASRGRDKWVTPQTSCDTNTPRSPLQPPAAARPRSCPYYKHLLSLSRVTCKNMCRTRVIVDLLVNDVVIYIAYTFASSLQLEPRLTSDLS
ncbi:unnamed protein product [Chrysodeixis includens]|uniref:Uncharacterized protein n=1 Tax=Chrysodeixis includens TaxID=689277 RepID=A0A9N8PXB7_CHRIL|nr:unnamed protein product [Chrysodeixis includens]